MNDGYDMKDQPRDLYSRDELNQRQYLEDWYRGEQGNLNKKQESEPPKIDESKEDEQDKS